MDTKRFNDMVLQALAGANRRLLEMKAPVLKVSWIGPYAEVPEDSRFTVNWTPDPSRVESVHVWVKTEDIQENGVEAIIEGVLGAIT